MILPSLSRAHFRVQYRIMKKTLTAAALAAMMSFGAIAPALADGAASTRNIIIGGAAAAVLITNYNHKVRQKRAEQRAAAARRQAYLRRHPRG